MIAIIDYEGGNLTSVRRAVRHVGYEAVITQDPHVIDKATRLIFPGVGAAGASMEVLNRTGLTGVVKTQVLEQKKPFLAICIGIQILFDHSEEDDTPCLGILPGVVKRFPDSDPSLKIPQIGWNQVRQVRPHPLFEGVPQDAEFYFVNSYYCVPDDPSVVIGETEYGLRFASAVTKDNLFATQFHLEKSGPVGLRMLKNFCEWVG
ncbi:MAG TPA: imidazole glycerol phosphate synthase subunit HisH [bacterium]|nr:imidazole glycerol phosphate synthase subunit HisH [Candidatus Omnitrophota bacterium]HOJ60645.1 imidazole glycerol phosphate synthase subunit HisH [bacterium]